jgi:hypothetical protein
VNKPSARAAKDANGNIGQQWELPLAGSNCKRVTTDKNGKTAWVWDVTFHTETFTMLSKQPRLLNLVVESAIEHVEKTNKVKLDRKFSRPKLRFKGTTENPDKPAVTVRSLVCIFTGAIRFEHLKPNTNPRCTPWFECCSCWCNTD